MCAQCMMGAVAAGAGATGARAWIAARLGLGPRALKRVTIGLLAASVLAAGLISGTAA